MKTATIVTTILLGVFIMQALHAMTLPTSRPAGMQSSAVLFSHQFKDRKFNGVSAELNMSFIDFVSGTIDYFSNGNMSTPDVHLPTKPVNLHHFTHTGNDQLNVTWLGHSSLMINMDGCRVLTDPVFEKRVTLLGPSRFNGDIPVDIHQLPPVDAVIISHDHYDHLNKYSVLQLSDKTDRYIVPLAAGTRLAKWGIPVEKIVELDWWETYRLDDSLTVVATPAQHFSGRGLTDRNKTLWASWVVQSPYHKIFFSGDTGYFEGFKQIGEKYGPFNMTFIECGAYNAAWSQVHMFPEQTVQAHVDLGGKVLHPIHWGTFNLALHPWYEPMERLVAAANTAGVSIATPVVGDTTTFNNDLPYTGWWRQAMAQQVK
jgi:L-ascorbate metabolism protein UlaG (beta-lactamase superfamily)